MMLSLPRLALLGALLLVYSATAQLPIPEGRCVTFEEDSAPLSQCQSVIPAGTKVFITLNSSLAAVDAEVATFTAPFRLALTTRECSDAAMRLFCAQAFPNCQEQALPTGVTREKLTLLEGVDGRDLTVGEYRSHPAATSVFDEMRNVQ